MPYSLADEYGIFGVS